METRSCLNISRIYSQFTFKSGQRLSIEAQSTNSKHKSHNKKGIFVKTVYTQEWAMVTKKPNTVSMQVLSLWKTKYGRICNLTSSLLWCLMQPYEKVCSTMMEAKCELPSSHEKGLWNHLLMPFISAATAERYYWGKSRVTDECYLNPIPELKWLLKTTLNHKGVHMGICLQSLWFGRDMSI